MLMLITAAASAASSRRSQWTYDPSPIGTPWRRPRRRRRSCRRLDRASSIRAIIRASASGSGQRSGDASASSRERVALAGSTATPPTSAVNDQTSIPSSRRNAPGDAAGGDARRGLARRGPLQDVADVVEAVLERAGEVGVAGPDAGDRRAPACRRRRRRHASARGRLVVSGSTCMTRVQFSQSRLRDEQEDRRAERAAVPDPGQDLGPIVLDRLSCAAAVAALAAGEVAARGSAS